MSKKDSSKGSKLMKYMKVPLRFLKNVRDRYVNGMLQCSRDFTFVDQATMACHTTMHSVPWSFSVDSARSTTSEYDFNELVRVVSLGIKDGSNHHAEAMKVPQSPNVGMETIEENEVCVFGDDYHHEIKVKPLLQLRSRSCHQACLVDKCFNDLC